MKLLHLILCGFLFVVLVHSDEDLRNIRQKLREGNYTLGIQNLKTLWEKEKQRQVPNWKRQEEIANLLGFCFDELGKYSEAQKYFQQSLAIAKKINDKSLQGTALLNLGNVAKALQKVDEALNYYRAGIALLETGEKNIYLGTAYSNMANLVADKLEYENALPLYNKAMAIFNSINRPDYCAITLISVADIYRKTYQYSTALSYYQKAIPDLRSQYSLIYAYLGVGGVYKDQANYPEALRYYQEALKLALKRQGKIERALCYNNIGTIYQVQNKYSEALLYYEKALEIRIELGHEMSQGLLVLNIGIVYNSQQYFAKSLEYFAKAKTIFYKYQHKQYLAVLFNHEAGAYQSLGNYEKALKLNQEALKIHANLGQQQDVGISWENIGNIYSQRGEYREALKYFQKALKIYEKHQWPDQMANVYNNMSISYLNWEQYEESLNYIRKSLEINKKIGRQKDIAICQNNLGRIFHNEKKYSLALDHYNKAIEITKELGLDSYYATTLINMSAIFHHQGELKKAIDYYLKAEEILEKSQQQHILAVLYTGLGCVYNQLENYDKAVLYQEKALQILEKNLDNKHLPSAYYNVAASYYGLRKYELASVYFEKAIAAIEKIRKEAPEEFRISYFDQVAFFYKSLIASYLEEKKLEQAYETFEWSRNKDLIEKLDSNNPSIPSLTKIAQNLSKDTVVLAYVHTRWKLYQFVITKDTITVHQTSIKLENDIAQTNFAILPQNFSARGTDKIISLADDSLQKSEFVKLVEHYRDLLKNPDAKISEINEIGKQLSSLLIGKATSDIEGKKEIIVVADNIIQLIPFETLIALDGKYLVEKAIIRYSSSMAVLSVLESRKYSHQEKAILLVGNPKYHLFLLDRNFTQELEKENISAHLRQVLKNKKIYLSQKAKVQQLQNAKHKIWKIADSDKICYIQLTSLGLELRTQIKPQKLNKQEIHLLTKEIQQKAVKRESLSTYYQVLNNAYWENLPNTANEIQYISSLFPHSVPLLWEEATEQNVKSMDLSTFSIIHFSAHGLTVPEIPDLSSVVLSQSNNNGEDGYLTLKEIEKLTLKADFVCLSACETNLGKLYEGEGVVGIFRSFLIAGGNGICGSLWSVEDKGTAQFMKTLYQNINSGMDYATALSYTKLQFIHNKNVDNNYSHPFFWAPFIFYGKTNISTPPNYPPVVEEQTKITWLLVIPFVLLLISLASFFGYIMYKKNDKKRKQRELRRKKRFSP